MKWSHGVMVSTLDFESSDPSSNLGGTLILFLFFSFYFRINLFTNHNSITEVTGNFTVFTVLENCWTLFPLTIFKSKQRVIKYLLTVYSYKSKHLTAENSSDFSK